MVSSIFSYILRFGIEAGWLAAALIVLRLILRKAPRGIICAMWALVAVRLIFPFDIKSVFSLVPDTRKITRPVSYAASEAARQAYPNIDSAPLMTANGIQSNSTVASGDAVGAHLFYLASAIWLIGVCLMLIYAVFSYIRLYRPTRESIKTDDFFICDRISSPFILGIFRPRIILPFDISEDDRPYVLAHERAHLKRRDHLWKPLGYLLLSVYWFNPLLWAAYILLCKDIELACDERVIKELGYDCKKPYANALINAATPKRLITACPVAFGETSVKTRVKNILSYKKPAFWIIIIAVILSIVVAVCFLTNPADKSGDTAATDSVSTGVSAEYVWSSFEESTSPQDGYGFVRLRVNNNTDQHIAVDMSGFRVYKEGKPLTPSSSDDTQYYDFYKAGTSKTTLFSVYPYLAEIDTKSTFRLEADYYSFKETDASDIDGEYPPNVGKEPLGSISVDFKFLSKEERGDVPDFLYEILYHDIDGDGEEEMLVLSPGPTSGLNSITVGAYDKDTRKQKYEPESPIISYSFHGESDHFTIINGHAVLVTGRFGYPDSGLDNADNASLYYYVIKTDGGKLYFEMIGKQRVAEMQKSPTDAQLEKLEPIEAVNKFFQVNYRFFTDPDHESDWNWSSAKAEYFGGTYLEGAQQVIMLTNIDNIDSFEMIGNNIRYEKCNYTLEYLKAEIKSINSSLDTMKRNNEGYSESVVEIALIDNENIIEVSIFAMTDEKVKWFKEAFGDKEEIVFRNVTTMPDEDVSGEKVSNIPAVIFTNGETVYISGECGIIFYDIENGKIKGMLSPGYLKELGFEKLYAYASPDGEKIYMYDMSENYDPTGEKRGVFDLTSGTIATQRIDIGTDEELFGFDSVAKSISPNTLVSVKD